MDEKTKIDALNALLKLRTFALSIGLLIQEVELETMTQDNISDLLMDITEDARRIGECVCEVENIVFK